MSTLKWTLAVPHHLMILFCSVPFRLRVLVYLMPTFDRAGCPGPTRLSWPELHFLVHHCVSHANFSYNTLNCMADDYKVMLVFFHKLLDILYAKYALPPIHMQAKAFLMLTAVQIETIEHRASNVMCSIICRNLYCTQHPQTRSIPTPSTTHIYTYTFVTTSKKRPKTSYRKNILPKSAKEVM